MFRNEGEGFQVTFLFAGLSDFETPGKLGPGKQIGRQLPSSVIDLGQANDPCTNWQARALTQITYNLYPQLSVRQRRCAFSGGEITHSQSGLLHLLQLLLAAQMDLS